MEYKKSAQYGMIFAQEAFVTPTGRFTWVNLQTPRPGMKQKDGSVGDAKYEITLLLDKSKKENKLFVEQLEAMTDEMLPLFNKGSKSKISEVEVLKDGDSEDIEKYPYYENCWILKARNKNKVVCYSNKRDETGELIPVDAAEILGGMIGRLIVSMSLGSYGVAFRVENVKLIKDDGTRFGGGVRNHSALLKAVDDDEEEGEEATEEDTEEVEIDEDNEEELQASEESDEDEDAEEEEEEPAPKKRGRPAGSSNGSKKSLEDIRANAINKRKGKAAVADVL